MTKKYDSIVVGAGIAGLTAATYLARAGQSVLLIERQSKVGGLIQTFEREGVYFDGGLRSIENSGVVFPMLKQLGIDIDFVKSKVSIGIGDTVLTLENRASLADYEDFLQKQFPENKQDVSRIIQEIKKSMEHMDVLYGIDNPAFLDLMADKKYLLKVILPWMFKFIRTVRKITNLNQPVDEYLQRFTSNQQLIDIIAQHFFQKTPASFALSYFSLYLDYFYPKGGTAMLPSKLEECFRKFDGEIKLNTTVLSIEPEQKKIHVQSGEVFEYTNMIWAGDTKQLYNLTNINEIGDKKLKQSIVKKREQLRDLKAGDSVFSAFITVDLDREYFASKCSGHFFYTPSKTGLSTMHNDAIQQFIAAPISEQHREQQKEMVIKYLMDYCALNTYEISIPILRDPNMAPEGKAGLIVSLLYDYNLALKIEEYGWTAEIKQLLEQTFIQVLDRSIFPGLKQAVTSSFSSSPLTIEKRTGNTEGGITGWAFTNPIMPAESRMLQIYKSVDTLLPSVYQAGQWVYSPSGMPTCILTGKLASDKVLKKSK